MSRLSELIEELCPNGVQTIPVEEIAAVSKQRIASALVRRESFVGVENLLSNKAGKVSSKREPTDGSLTEFQPGDILIGNIRPYLRKVWLADHAGGASGDVAVVHINDEARNRISSRYLYYLLSSENFFVYYNRTSRGGKMPRGDKRQLGKFLIQVPPLEVQQEIVRILDNFTQLEAELEAELEARRKQFEHYRNQLLTFGEGGWTTMGDLAVRVCSGATPLAGVARYYADGSVSWLRTREVRFSEIWETEVKITPAAVAETGVRIIPANCVIVAISGATAGRAAVNRIPLATNQHCCNFELDPTKVSYRYVYHWVASRYTELKNHGQGARADLNATIIKSLPVCLPSLDEQHRIAASLDLFESLLGGISDGLPGEITARRKQYEYYRDKLLTFKELK